MEAVSSDADDLADSYEAEGIEAFDRLTTAVNGLGSRLSALEAGLGSKLARAEETASTASLAAANAMSAAGHAEATARAGARSVAAWAVLGSLAGILAAGGAGYWLGHTSGRQSALAQRYRDAMDEKAAASWANTPAGQLALALDRAGSLSMVARCSNRGWKAEARDGGRVCFVRADGEGNLYGWRLP